MAGNLTLAIIKPHAVRARNVGKIIDRIETAGFGIIGSKMIQVRKEGAEEFYKEHKTKDFFENLVRTMCASPVWVMILIKDNAVEEWRNTIGSTHPAEAAEGTIRNVFGDHNNITDNAVHGSATDHDAQKEVLFFFGREIKLGQRVNQFDPKNGF